MSGFNPPVSSVRDGVGFGGEFTPAACLRFALDRSGLAQAPGACAQRGTRRRYFIFE